MLDQIAHKATDWAAIVGLGGSILGVVGTVVGIRANLRARFHQRDAQRWKKRHHTAMKIARYFKGEAEYYAEASEGKKPFRKMPD